MNRKKTFKQVSLPKPLLETTKHFVEATPFYNSVSSFVQEAVRVHLLHKINEMDFLPETLQNYFETFQQKQKPPQKEEVGT